MTEPYSVIHTGMSNIAHWDDAMNDTNDVGPIANHETWLSGAVGSRRLGVSRYEVPAGKATSPQHAEDEEVFYVMSGSGWSVQENGCFAIGPGDVVFYGAYEPAHTVVAGDDGLQFIAFGTSDPPRGLVRFPRIGKVKVMDVLVDGDRTHQWELEGKLDRIEVSDPPDERPRTIRHIDEAPSMDYGFATARFLTRDLGAVGIALNHAKLNPGAPAAPPHCHSMEEELFVVLSGDGVVILGDEETPVRAGSIVGRPPATGVAHAFRAGDNGMELLLFSDKHGNDMCFYPETGQVSLRGLGVVFTPEIERR
jgi:uncharacterized cupin superfamily protein